MNPQIPLDKQSLSKTFYRFPCDRTAMEKLKQLLNSAPSTLQSLADGVQQSEYYKAASTLPSSLPVEGMKRSASSLLDRLLEELSRLLIQSKHAFALLCQKATSVKFIEDFLTSAHRPVPSFDILAEYVTTLLMTLKAVMDTAVGYVGKSYRYIFSQLFLRDVKRGLKQYGLDIGDAICHNGIPVCNGVIEWLIFGKEHYKGILATAILLYNFDSVLLLMLLAVGRLKKRSGVIASAIYQNYSLDSLVPQPGVWLKNDRDGRCPAVAMATTQPSQRRNLKWTLFKYAMLWVSAQFVYYRFFHFVLRLVSQPRLQLLLSR